MTQDNWRVLATAAAMAIALAAPPGAQAVPLTFSNLAAIDPPDSGTATPYPSEIVVAGVGTSATSITASIFGISHTFPDDLDILLVSPLGGTVMLMSDAGGSAGIVGIDLAFADGSPSLPNFTLITAGTYAPTDFGAPEVLPAPAPGGPYGTTFAGLLGGNLDGTWGLYVQDDVFLDDGFISGGYSITFEVGGGAPVPEPGTLPLMALGGLALAALARRGARRC